MHFKNSFLLFVLLILSSPFKSQEVKIFRTCYNFEYPILLELHGVLQPDQEASPQGHYFKAHYADKSKFYRLDRVEHYYNGKLCPILSNDKYIEYLTGGYGSTNYNSKVAKIVFNYDKENRIERIKFLDTNEIPCHNRFFKSSYQYIYNGIANTDFNVTEKRFFLNLNNGKETESPRVAQNTLPLTIHYNNPKPGERKYITKCFIPINSELTHNYAYNESGILKSKTMEFTFKDASKKVNTSNYETFYDIVSRLAGIHRIELEFDTETGYLKKIKKLDINGQLYGINAEITSDIKKENNEYKITTTYKDGNGVKIANFLGQQVEILTLDNQLRKKVMEYLDFNFKNKVMNSNAIAQIEYQYLDKDQFQIIRKTLDVENNQYKNLDENSNPNYEIPCEKFTYNSEGEEIKYEKLKDNKPGSGYFLSPYDSSALTVTNIKIVNDLKEIVRNYFWDKGKYVSGEYQTSLDTSILDKNGLIVKSVRYNKPDSKTPFGFEYQYDEFGRIIKTGKKNSNNPSKVLNYVLNYLDNEKSKDCFSIELVETTGDGRIEKYEFENRELKSINYKSNQGARSYVLESYEGSDISGYEYQYDNQGRKIKETVTYIDNPEIKQLITKNEYSNNYLDEAEKITFKAIDLNIQEIDYHDFYNEKTHIEQRRIDIWGNVENETSLDVNKSPVKKYSIDRKYDKSGNLVEQTKKDLNNNITGKEVYSAHSFNNKPEKISYYKGQNSLIKTSEFKYDVFGNITKEKHLDANGLIPFSWNSTKKIATISYNYDVNKNCIERSYFDINDKPILNDSNIHMYKYIWIKQNNNWVKIAEASFIKDKENENVSVPIIPETKIHSVEYKYDENGLKIQKAFYGEPKNQSSFKNDINKQENKGNPAEDIFGIHCYNTRYNVNYFIDSGSFLDKYGKLKINGNDACRCAKFSYKIGYNDDYAIDTTEWRLYNENEKLFIRHSHESEGYVVKEKDKKSNGYFLLFKNVNGKRIKDNKGVSGYRIEFMEDGSFSKININDQRKEIVNKDGYSRIQYHYNDNQELSAILKFNKNKLVAPIRIGEFDFSIDGKPLKKD